VLLGSCIFIFYAWQILTAEAYWQFLLVAPLGGIAGSSFFIVLYALLLKTIDKNQVGKKIAFYQSGMYLGLGIGPAIGGILIREGGFGALLWGVLAGGLIAVSIWAVISVILARVAFFFSFFSYLCIRLILV